MSTSDKGISVAGISAGSGAVGTPADCSMLFQSSANLRHPATIDTNQPRDNMFMGWGKPTPSPLAFWFQPPFLGPTPKSTQDTNQAFDISPREPKTPTAFWLRPLVDPQRHVPTIYTAQSFVCNPTIGPPVPVDAFWTQAPDLLNHPHSLDTNQPLNDTFVGWTNNTPTPSSLGFFVQAPDLLRHPATLDTRPQFEFAPPPTLVTPADCSFLYQPSALLRHPATLDTNQPLDDTFAGIPGSTPANLGFFTQAPDLFKHPGTIDTNQPRLIKQDTATPASFGFWTQAPDLLRHPSTVDTNQPTLVSQVGTTPSAFGFWVQPQDLLRHANTIDTNQPFVFNPPAPAQTPSAYWWFQPPDLLRHPPHLDTNQPRLVSQVGATPSALGFWRQSPNLLKHPATLDTRQQFVYLPPPQPPFGWLVQAQDLLRHPVPFILGGEYSFALLPPKISANAIIKVYFFN